MMESTFNLIAIVKKIDAEPMLLVAFSAFHILGVFLLPVPLWFFEKIGIYDPKKELGVFGSSLGFIIGIGWILGFMSQIMFFFMGVSGIKMLLIYISMYLCIIAFVTFNVITLKNSISEFENYRSIHKKDKYL